MTDRIKVNSDVQGDIFILLRNDICGKICPGGRKCLKAKCAAHIAGLMIEIEIEMEAAHVRTDKP